MEAVSLVACSAVCKCLPTVSSPRFPPFPSFPVQVFGFCCFPNGPRRGVYALPAQSKTSIAGGTIKELYVSYIHNNHAYQTGGRFLFGN